jgi:hypothetical protein
MVSSHHMDRNRPERDPYRIDSERITELTSAAQEQMARDSEVTRYTAATPEMVAHLLGAMLTTDERHTFRTLQHAVRRAGVAGTTLRIADIDAALEIGERLFAAEGSYLIWIKETEDRTSYYSLDRPTYDEPTTELVNAIIGMQDVPPLLIERVFGQELSDVFGGVEEMTLPNLRAVLRERYKLPNVVIDVCVHVMQEAGFATLITGKGGSLRARRVRAYNPAIVQPAPQAPAGPSTRKAAPRSRRRSR